LLFAAGRLRICVDIREQESRRAGEQEIEGRREKGKWGIWLLFGGGWLKSGQYN